MDRKYFEQLLQLKNKSITIRVDLSESSQSSFILVARNIIINNGFGCTASMTIRYNTKTDAKTINVCVEGIGPICRLDVDGQVHGQVGRCHKHELRDRGCPKKNIPHATSRAHLSGKNIEEVFGIFCQQALINHNGIKRV